jgi:hypothetical protein
MNVKPPNKKERPIGRERIAKLVEKRRDVLARLG